MCVYMYVCIHMYIYFFPCRKYVLLLKMSQSFLLNIKKVLQIARIKKYTVYEINLPI